MRSLHDITELIIAAWKLANPEKRIPSSHGIMDLALEYAVNKKVFPEWARDTLTFRNASVGLECRELAEILYLAQRGGLTTAPNPSYSTTEIQVSERVVKRLLRRLEVDVEEAISLGKALFEGTEEARKDLCLV